MGNEEIKKTYDRIVKEKFRGDYEYHRWFKDEILQAGYEATKQTISRHFLAGLKFTNYLEVGPGPGTWTRLFLEKNKEAEFTLVDISAEMLKLAEKNLAAYRLNFFESDFLNFSTGADYDLFFSSRALEYFPDKNGFIKKVASLLTSGATGFIITKMPRYWAYKIIGRTVPAMHQDQITPAGIKDLLLKNGFTGISFYPAIMTFPFFHSARLDRILFRTLGPWRLNFFNRYFCESYAVKFTKK